MDFPAKRINRAKDLPSKLDAFANISGICRITWTERVYVRSIHFPINVIFINVFIIIFITIINNIIIIIIINPLSRQIHALNPGNEFTDYTINLSIDEPINKSSADKSGGVIRRTRFFCMRITEAANKNSGVGGARSPRCSKIATINPLLGGIKQKFVTVCGVPADPYGTCPK